MRRWHQLPLRYQLALVAGAVLTGLLVTFSTVLYLSLQRFLFWQAAQELTLTASSAVSAYVPASPVRSGSGDVVQAEPVDPPPADDRTSVIIWAADGTPLVQGHLVPGLSVQSGSLGSLAPSPGRPVSAPMAIEAASPPFMVTGGEERQIAVRIPLLDRQGTSIGTLQVATPIEPLEEILARLFRYLVAGTLVTVLGGMALCAIASAQVLRPLDKLVDASAAVAAGDLTTRVHLPKGNEIGKVGAAFDEMVARMAESWAAHQRFLVDAAHELRTPLTAISGSIEMLQIGAVDHQPERRRRLLQSVSEELDRLGRLVHDLMLLTNLDARATPAHVPCDLRPLLLDVIEQARIVAPGHQFVLDMPDPLPVRGNADHLRQIFLNLVTNAHTYTPQGGTITVTGWAGKMATVAVADTGAGIPAEDLPRVWERLYRVDRARAHGAGGFGLGLAIVHKLVATHGGEASIASEVGKGTTVTVTLPLDRAAVHTGSTASGNL